ncbi:copper chaperone taha [Flagelloscypha sp. PMI_526]|nr:copper chaperone taha [Flagelloscypha sp. PMI_526]
MSENQYKFNVEMSCTGGSSAIEKVLTKAKNDSGSTGISDFSVDYETKIVLVKGTASYDDVHARIAKTGKKIVSSETL